MKPLACVLALLCALPLALSASQASAGAGGPSWTPRLDYQCGVGARVSAWYEPKATVLFIDGKLERFAAANETSNRFSNGRFEWVRQGNGAMYLAKGQSGPSQQQCQPVALAAWREGRVAQRYICADGLTVEVTRSLESATLVFRGETYQMREVATAGGTLYTDGVRAWRGPDTNRSLSEADGDAVFARGCHKGALADTATLTGTVVYRTRQALPAGAVLETRLLDVSPADGAAAVLARAVSITTGQQVPLPFALTYSPAAIETGHRYTLEATIALGGRQRFRTTAAHPVLGEGTAAGPIEVVVQPVR